MKSTLDQRSQRLLQEVTRAPENGITNFNSDVFRQVIENISEHHESMKKSHDKVIEQSSENADGQGSSEGGGAGMSAHPQHASAFLTHHDAILRNKRALCVYTNERVKILKGMYWEHGQVPQDLSEEMHTKMSPEERDFCSTYKSALDSYMDKVGMDLTLQMQPPTKNMLEVRGKKEYGALMTEQGTFHISEGSTHLMQLEDAEQLIRDKVVSPVHKTKRIKRNV
eukprot:TRINITY_DN3954_c0_g1_i1.p1 TRINITY_DN3954_c0_g1~~TRINITY_DN3954_c0_g1_i1.p1  ORF type:complete len:225 (+),score=22.76 TRINITY_DN3954_c0_g1_i1:128-802(+)